MLDADWHGLDPASQIPDARFLRSPAVALGISNASMMGSPRLPPMLLPNTSRELCAAALHHPVRMLLWLKHAIQVAALRFGGHKLAVFIGRNVEVTINIAALAKLNFQLAPSRLVPNRRNRLRFHCCSPHPAMLRLWPIHQTGSGHFSALKVLWLSRCQDETGWSP